MRMWNVLIASAAGLAILCTTIPAFGQQPARGNQYTLVDNSVVRFRCRGEGTTRPATGRFSAVASTLRADPENLSTVRSAIDVVLASITTSDAGWDMLFRGAPFLDLNSFPRSQFQIREVRDATALRANRWVPLKLAGRFILHGVSRDVVVEGRARLTPATRQHRERIQFQGSFRIAWADHDILVPSGHTRTFTGTGADITIDLTYEKR